MSWIVLTILPISSERWPISRTRRATWVVLSLMASMPCTVNCTVVALVLAALATSSAVEAMISVASSASTNLACRRCTASLASCTERAWPWAPRAISSTWRAMPSIEAVTWVVLLAWWAVPSATCCTVLVTWPVAVPDCCAADAISLLALDTWAAPSAIWATSSRSLSIILPKALPSTSCWHCGLTSAVKSPSARRLAVRPMPCR